MKKIITSILILSFLIALPTGYAKAQTQEAIVKALQEQINILLKMVLTLQEQLMKLLVEKANNQEQPTTQEAITQEMGKPKEVVESYLEEKEQEKEQEQQKQEAEWQRQEILKRQQAECEKSGGGWNVNTSQCVPRPSIKTCRDIIGRRIDYVWNSQMWMWVCPWWKGVLP